MSSNFELKAKINEFLFENSEISSNDPLKNVLAKGVYGYSKENNLLAVDSNFLYRHYKQLLSDSGINPVCISSYSICFDRDGFWIPVFLQETAYDKRKNEFEPFGELTLNPYLKNLLKLNDEVLVNSVDSFCEIINNIPLNYEIKNDSYIGLFHPFRFELIKELTDLKEVKSYSTDLVSILNLEPEEINQNSFDWDNIELFSNNSFQNRVIDKIESHSLLVNGPPGTGKSQLIASLIGTCLFNDYSAIFVSEKKSAIDAVLEKLRNYQLDKFVLTYANGKQKRKKTILELKSTWDYLQYLNSNSFNVNNNYDRKAELFISKIFEVSKLVNLKELINILDRKESKKLRVIENSEIDESQINLIMKNISSISSKEFDILQKVRISEYNEITYKKQIKELKSIFSQLKGVSRLKCKKDLDDMVVLSLKIRNFQSNYFIQYETLLSSKKNAFLKAFQKWKILNKEMENFKIKFSHWDKLPSVSEINTINHHLNNTKYFKLFKVKKYVKQFTKIESSIALNELNELKKYHLSILKLNDLEKAFYKLGVLKLNDLGIINDMIHRFNEKDYVMFKKMHQNEIDFLYESQPKISLFNSKIENHFKLLPDDEIEKSLFDFQEIGPSIIKLKTIYQKLNKSTLDLISKCKTIDEVLYNQILSFFKSKFKHLSFPSRTSLREQVNELITNIKQDELIQKKSADLVTIRIYEKFNEYQKLIVTPNQKLEKDNIELKKKLKKGKKILIHEFSKKRNFKSLRELMESDACHWIRIINPILMLNPFQLSSFAPMKKDLFSLGIIDEASQMPISHALGTMQRCQRMIIAGDENQIQPLSFFSSNSKKDTSILHQAKYHLPEFQLRYHYRSEKKALIEFSNKYFYNNQLHIIENIADQNDQCLFHHYVKDGLFEDKKNISEAKEFALMFTDFLRRAKNGKIMSFAIIAFSQSQLNQIMIEISKINSGLIERMEHENRIIIKTLDQVQGEEADIVFISFGYGKNKNHKFDMRFGPVNLNGGDKRLNVLFSRAKKELHFFSSVKYHDFKKTDNLGVKTLINWFAYIENINCLSKNQKSNGQISFFELMNNSPSGHDLIHLIKIHHLRGWSFIFD